MRKLLWAFILGGVLTLTTACAPSKLFEAFQPQYKSQDDCGFVQNIYGERISWKDRLPIPVKIHESVPSEFYPAIKESIAKWESASGKPLFKIVEFGTKGPINPRQDGVNLIYNMDTWEDQKSTEQARTSIYWVGDQIREFDVRINSKDFRFYSTEPQNGNDVHLTSLLIHELGHALGLKHKDAGGSVMGTYLASNLIRSQIVSTDLEALSCEYL